MPGRESIPQPDYEPELEFDESAMDKMREYMEWNPSYERRATLSGYPQEPPLHQWMNPNAVFESEDEAPLGDALDRLHETMLGQSEQAATAIRGEKPPSITRAHSTFQPALETGTGRSTSTSSKKTVRFFQESLQPESPAPIPPEPVIRKKSLFAHKRQQGSTRREFLSADDSLSLVMSDVVEKDVVSLSFASPTTLRKDVLSRGFPDTQTRIPSKTHDKTALKPGSSNVSQPTIVNRPTSNTIDQSIHEENMEKLKSMDPSDIQQARQELLQHLDPSIIEMIKKRMTLKQETSLPADMPAPVAAHSTRVATQSSDTSVILETSNQQEPVEPSASTESTTSQPPTKIHRKDIPNWIPPDKIEDEKLEWMFPSDQDTVSDQVEAKKKSLLESWRFGFDGRVIKENVPEHMGLHHHGEESDKAGYSIKEILLLCRSTVPAQRVVGLNTLASILGMIRMGVDEDVSAIEKDEIEYWLCHLNYVLYIRSSLSDKHDTVFAAGLSALAAFLDIRSQSTVMSEEDCWQWLSLTRMGYRGLSIGVDAVTSFKLLSRGLAKPAPSKKQEPVDFNSLQFVLDQLKIDSIKALLQTDIVYELFECVKKRALSTSQFDLIVEILIRLSRHSIDCATHVVQCQDLLNVICEKGIRGVWPSTKIRPVVKVIRLVRLLVQSSRKNAETILKSGVVEYCNRFMAMSYQNVDPVLHSTCLALQRESWQLLTSLLSYGLGAWMVDEYRPLFLMHLQSLSSGPMDDPQMLMLIALNRLLTTILNVFGTSLHIGMHDDSFKPLVEACWSLLKGQDWFKNPVDVKWNPKNDSNACWTVLTAISSTLDVMTAYCNQMKKDQPSAKAFAHYLCSSLLTSWSSLPLVKSIYSALHDACDLKINPQLTHFHPRLEPFGLGLRRATRLQVGVLLVQMTLLCNVVSSWIDLIVKLALIEPVLWKGVHQVDIVQGNVRLLVLKGVSAGLWGYPLGVLRHDWMRWFGAGWNQLQLSWIEGCGGAMPLNSTSTRRMALESHQDVLMDVYKVTLDFISNALPGDECVTSRLFHTCITGESWRHFILSGTQYEEAWKYLREYYDVNLWNMASLTQSEGCYQRGSVQELNSLVMDLSERGRIGLPMAVSWVFAPLDMLVDESRLNVESDEENVATSVLVSCLLEFIQSVTRLTEFEDAKYWTLGRWPMEHEMKMARLCGLYYHHTSVYLIQDIFLDRHIQEYLMLCNKQLYETIDMDQVHFVAAWMERRAGGQMKCYSHYRLLVEQFQACSFGNAAFAHCLLVAFLVGFAPDYRSYLFTELTNMLRSFDAVKPLCKLDYFLHKSESNREVQSCFVKALVTRSGDYDTFQSCLLGRVCRWHVADYLFRDIPAWKQNQHSMDKEELAMKRKMVDTLVGSPIVWKDILSLDIEAKSITMDVTGLVSSLEQQDRLDYIKSVLLLVI